MLSQCWIMDTLCSNVSDDLLHLLPCNVSMKLGHSPHPLRWKGADSDFRT